MNKQKIPTPEEAARYIWILNEDHPIDENNKIKIKESYLGYHHKVGVHNINNEDMEKAFYYYFDLLGYCDDNSLCFKNLLDIFIDAEIEIEVKKRGIAEEEIG